MNSREKLLIQSSNDRWDKMANWWDKSVADGDSFHVNLIFPNILKLMGEFLGKRILDLGCGNGALARILEERGGTVVGVDVSEKLIDCARKRSSEKISYRILDATSEKEFSNKLLGETFDIIIVSIRSFTGTRAQCNMVW